MWNSSFRFAGTDILIPALTAFSPDRSTQRRENEIKKRNQRVALIPFSVLTPEKKKVKKRRQNESETNVTLDMIVIVCKETETQQVSTVKVVSSQDSKKNDGCTRLNREIKNTFTLNYTTTSDGGSLIDHDRHDASLFLPEHVFVLYMFLPHFEKEERKECKAMKPALTRIL